VADSKQPRDCSGPIYFISVSHSLRVFIVENHPDTLLYLQRYLEQLGNEVHVAGDMATALKKVPELNVDLLISDIGLPDGDGWELMRQLGTKHSFLAVAMSGCGANADKAQSRSVGYRHHLIKPFLPDELDPILNEARQLAESRSVGK
jgi:two-component system CheB/CheR fusion protein